jgi:transposase InsO family protein
MRDRGRDSLRSQDVTLILSRLMRLYGKPAYVRSDNGAEFTVAKVMRWLRDAAIGPAFFAPGSPWQNAFVESFNGKLLKRGSATVPRRRC